MIKTDFFNLERKAAHEKEGFLLFYRVWYCVIISQVNLCGIIVEIIWSYNQYNFFFWLTIYSVYSVFTCLSAILHNKYEMYLSVLIIIVATVFSRVLHFFVRMILSGISITEILTLFT